jgi:hypothetical protein
MISRRTARAASDLAICEANDDAFVTLALEVDDG